MIMSFYLQNLREVLRLSPILIVGLPLFFSGIEENPEWLYFSAGAFLSEKVNHHTKKLIFKYFSNYPQIYRPPGAIQCGVAIQPNATKPWTNLGMPSGHSQIVGFFSGYFIYRIINKKENRKLSLKQIVKKEKTKLITLIVIVFLGMIARLNISVAGFISADKYGCHTLEQVVVGGSLGLVYGMLWNRFYPEIKKMLNNKCFR